MSQNWYLDNPFWQEFGGVMFDEARFEAARRDLTHLMDLTELRSGHVLDLGSGPGRFTLPLAEQGFEVCAVDTSASLLDELQRRMADLAPEAQARIEVIQEDMRTFSRPDSFDWVMIMWSTFGYFEKEADHSQVLDLVYQNLKDNGILLLDLVGLEYLARHLEPVHLTEFDDGRLLIERPLLVDDMTRLDNEWLLIDGEQVKRTSFSHRVWSGGELSQLLAQHGFEVLGVYGDYAGSAYDLDAERMVFVVKRKALI